MFSEPGQLAAFAFSAAFLGFVLELVRRRALTVRYSLVWLTIGAGMVVASSAAYPGVLRLAPRVGFAYPPSMLFFLAFGGLVLAALSQSAVLTRLSAENARLCQRLAILEAEMDEIRRARPSGDRAPSSPPPSAAP